MKKTFGRSMKARFRFIRRAAVVTAALVAVIASIASVSQVAIATGSGDGDGARPEHWGIITRNTIGSPVGDLRFGPYGSFGVTGPSARPPFGIGSLGIEVANSATTLIPPSEKVDFGNEVDFFGDPVLALNEVGFHVFQTGENASLAYGGPRNMPNIRFEIDANVSCTLPTDNYTTMVWVPDAVPVGSLNRWSGYIDATTSGNWYFTGAEMCTGCTQALNCTFTQAMTALTLLNNGSPPIFYTVAVGKGRDNIWVGAVDGFRLNERVFDFEPTGVHERGVDDGNGDDGGDDDHYDWEHHDDDDDDDN